MHIRDFLKVAFAATSRQADSYITQGIDVGLFAANCAKLWAQNEEDFEFCRKTVSFQVSKAAGVNIDTAILWEPDTSATDIAVQIKRLTKRAWTVNTRDGTSYLGVPIKVYSRDYDAANWRRSVERGNMPYNLNNIQVPSNEVSLIQHGNMVYLNPSPNLPNDASIEIAVDAYIYLPDYTETITEDFFLRECRNWMMHRTIFELDAYLKEDARVAQISKVVENSWNNVLKWNSYLTSDFAEKDLE